MSLTRGFGSDNHASVHPEVWEKIRAVNVGHAPAYGTDSTSEQARGVIANLFGTKKEQIYFVFNGTAANVLCLRALLLSHEAVITAESAHLAVDECGAPEFHGGHKILTVPTPDGKLTPELIKPLLVRLGDQHAVQPRLVSISQPTELGTVYTLKELEDLRHFTQQHHLLLHMDGARLANAVAFLNCTFFELTGQLGLDALSLGGTKNGLLGGEAVVFFGAQSPRHFKFIQKQELQLSSKTRFIAAQFLAYFENDLWRRCAARSLHLAQKLRQAIELIPNFSVTQKTQSNAVFVRIPKSWTQKLKEAAFFYVWDEKEWVARLMLSHDSEEEDIERFYRCALSLSQSQGETRHDQPLP